MATPSSSLLLVSSPLSPSTSPSFQLQTITFPQTLSLFRAQTRTKPIRTSIIKAQADVRKENIVIIEAGIAGLATALSLHRSLVVEQAESLRTGGTSLTLFKNGWRVLDAFGVGNDLRPQFLEIQGMAVKSEDGRELRSFKFKDEDGSQEVRAVERRILLETLVSQLPSDAV